MESCHLKHSIYCTSVAVIATRQRHNNGYFKNTDKDFTNEIHIYIYMNSRCKAINKMQSE